MPSEKLQIEKCHRKFSGSLYKILYIIVFILPLLIGGTLTYQKFSFSEAVKFSIISENVNDNHGVYDDFVILYPDEITYLNWILLRGDSFEKTLNGERGLTTNLYGYVISFVYLVTDKDWKSIFLFGVLGYVLFFYSCRGLLKELFQERDIFIIGILALIVLSPAVINLSSGFMRDLFILSFINFSIIAVLKRNLTKFIFILCLIFLMRNFMVVVLMPMYLYFYFYFSKKAFGFNKNLFIMSVSLVLAVFLYIALYSVGAVINQPIEIVFRFVELLTGINQVVINIAELYKARGTLFIEILSHIYQWLIIIVLYIFIIKSKFKVNNFIIPLLCSSLLLAILYGSFLGFFVARTKLIILWLSVLFLAMYLNEMKKRKVLSVRRRKFI